MTQNKEPTSNRSNHGLRLSRLLVAGCALACMACGADDDPVRVPDVLEFSATQISPDAGASSNVEWAGDCVEFESPFDRETLGSTNVAE